MSVFLGEPKYSVSIDYAIEQLSKGQDYICQGKGLDHTSGEPFEYVMLNDGHGFDDCINFIRAISEEKKAELIGSTTPIHALADHITSRIRFGGATIVLLKIYSNRAICMSSGDSQILIFKDGERFYMNEKHNCDNMKERERISTLGAIFKPTTNIQVTSETTMKSISIEYTVFKTGLHLACTQALGHNSITGYEPEEFVFYFEPSSSYRFILGSDGFFDMILLDDTKENEELKTKTCNELCNKAVDRWLQEWEACSSDGSTHKFTYEREECDDVGICLVEIKPF